MERQTRGLGRVEVRQIDEGSRQAEIMVCRYNVIDDYGTIWMPGCWSQSMERKLPKGVWGHDWLDIIGRAIGWEDTPEGLILSVQFSDFRAVPRAYQAWTQLRDGDVDEFSFGFEPVTWTIIDKSDPLYAQGARERITEAIMYEWSPVLVGAVPGTRPLAVRSALRSTGYVPASHASAVATRLVAGDIDLQEALTMLKESAVEMKEIEPDEPQETPDQPDEPQETPDQPDEEAQAALEAEIESALALVE